MKLSSQIAKHFREVHFGGNWTVSNLKDTLAGVTWQQATTKVQSLNTIAALVFHINYFVAVQLKVLQGGPLEGNDKFSYDVPPINSEEDWQKLKDKALSEAEQLATLIEQLPDSKWEEDFVDPKYGSYYRNLHGVIEHTHYHLGQIALLKKMLSQA
jgi:hypothetical protein